MIRAIQSFPVALGGCGGFAMLVSAAALAGSFNVQGEIAIAFFLGAFSTALCGGGLLLGSAKLARDSERRAAERRLEVSEARHRALVEHAPFCILELDRAGRIIARNPACRELFERAGEALAPDTPWTELLGKSDRLHAQRLLEHAFAGVTSEAELRTDQASDQRLLATRLVPLARGRDPDRVMGVLQDITEAHDLAERLDRQARHDALTGLVNRREFELRLARVLETAQRDGSEHALCYLDLDQFKIINDTCGHIAGDELLRQAGSLLQGCVRRRDTLARLGGDEFGVLMEHCNMDHAVRVGEQMRRALDDFRFLWGDRAFSIHVSIGVVALGSESGELEQVLGAADEACYAAKDNGRNRVHVYHENDHDLARRRGGTQWLAPLEHALEADEFRLMYQPIVPTRPDDSDARRFELLLRLLGDDGQLVLPGAFLPAAERHGLATRIDRWVLEHALAWLEHEANRGRPVSMCALNLSARSLVDDAFKAFVIERLRGRESLASSLVFEVSETAAIANLAATAGFMHALGGLGCRFAIDDFGSGLSSFSYLKSLPVDYLKIDGVFVRDMASNPVDRAMVRAINEIGQVMGKRTVAEFTEDARTAELIRELGVDFSQGYWIGRPQPIEPADDE